jgi:hypothetical protein
MYSSPPSYLFPFKPKYLPQHPIFKDPQPMFLPQCERQSFDNHTKQKAKL